MRNKHLLEKLAEALMDRETLDAEEIDAVMTGTPLPIREKVVIPTYKDQPRKKVLFVSPEVFKQVSAQQKKQVEKIRNKSKKDGGK